MSEVLAPTAQLALAIAAEPDRWGHLVRDDPGRRMFAPLDAGPAAGAWLICWMPGHDTGSTTTTTRRVPSRLVAGQVREERIGADWQVTGTTYGPGDAFSFVSGDIHRMLHVGDEPAISIHVYSPKLQVMGAYAFGSGGMQRHLLGPDDELKPLRATGA